MNFLPDDISDYAEGHTSAEAEYLKQLSRETWQKVLMPRMLSGHLQGRVLSMISKMIRPQLIFEIGTFTGYSALCLAEGLAENGQLITIDINDELKWIHEKYISTSPYASSIRCLYGDANELIPSLNSVPDLVFIDADKESYIRYYEMLLTRMKSGSWILIDNVLWSGKVLNEVSSTDVETNTLKALNDLIQRDPRVENVLLPLRDGIFVLRVV